MHSSIINNNKLINIHFNSTIIHNITTDIKVTLLIQPNSNNNSSSLNLKYSSQYNNNKMLDHKIYKALILR